MKNLFLILLTAISLHAGDVVTAVVVIDDSEQLTGSNAASITIDSDTRIWTNAVTSAGTQILANTNLATAVFRLQTHIASYPFEGVRLSTTNNGIVLKGADGEGLTVTISNAWATVTYRTNTYNSDNGIVVRIPHTDESTEVQNVVSDGLINWINIAPTNSIDEDATIADNLAGLTKSQIITGATTLSNVANVVYAKALQVHHSALTADSADTNFVADLLAGYRTITALGDLNFIQSTNRSAGRSILIRIDPNGTNRTLTFNSDWQFMGGAITTITNSTIGLLRLDCFGDSETNVHASYSVEGGFGSSGGVSDTDDQTAAEVAFTPAGNIAAATVQAALEEVDTEKQADDSDLDSIAAGITGIVKGGGNGAGYSAAAAGTDYLAPSAIDGADDISGLLDLIDDTQGAILFRSSDGWTNLPPGTSGQVLKSGGAAADVAWGTDNEGAGGSDSAAIHDDTAAEISAVTLKATPIAADEILIEDSADSYNKKSATVGSLPISTPTQTALDLKANSANPTLTSAIVTLNGTADGLTDDTYDGVTITGRNAGEAITQWDVVFFNASDSEFHQADADAAGEFPARGIAVASSTDGNAITVLVQGIVRNDGWTWGTVGGPIYLSDTAGGLTQTAPSTSGDAVQIVGWAMSDDEAYLNFSGHWVTAP